MAPKAKEAKEQTWPYKITIGICAMHRKATSKPMKAIMKKVIDFYGQWVDFFIFPEQTIINEPIENWPLCHCLISFHSTDFPLEKAISYVKLRNPYIINSLDRQYDLLDRRTVFKILEENGIEHPRHGYVIRGRPNEPDTELVEYPDHIEVNGEVFNKPFVEKPISSEDHNVYIYYPSSVGGGSQRLFRKINNRSSWYSPKSEVRKEGSYIYEEFIPADGTDVKVYAVGPFYAHAEARKAPGLDGKVERDSDGKEVRYPVILSNKEKQMAKKIVLAFGQTVCGFDLLRANGKSYVCDVNGFSFVKTSTKYYEDTAKILGNQIVRHYAKSKNWRVPSDMPQPPILDLGLGDDPPMITTPSGKLMELRCVVAVIRHGDRTPKQKMKLVVTDQRFFDLFEKHDGFKKNEIKMKKPNQLMEVLELARALVHEKQQDRHRLLETLKECVGGDEEEVHRAEQRLEACEEDMKKWEQMRTVLEMYGHFSGINRKVQMKYLKERETKTSDEELKREGAALLLILKWGGELTTAGNMQAEALGRLFRTLYPGIRRTDGKSSPEDTQGLGFLRLHSTYRHDLKIYASDEGRVQTTAAAFAKGLLALEGELTPILMQMVKSANTDGLLDDDCQARLYQTELKRYLHKALQADRDFTPQDYLELNPNGLRSITNAMEFIKNPRKMCHEIAGYVEKMCGVLQEYSQTKHGSTLYLQESMDLAQRRWNKELREFRRKNKHGEVEFDISKIPDIYDNIKYDMEHNPDLCINNEVEFERMYLCVKNMADIVVPQEYGIKTENKMVIAQRVCTPLLRKIRNDLHRCLENKESEETQTRLDPRASQGIATPFRHVRTRLYFTSESHIHTLMNLIRYGNLCSVDDKKWQRAMNFLSGVTEFNYMTQVVLMVYEDSRKDKDVPEAAPKFHIEILFSPGLYPCFLTEKERIYESRFNLSTNPKPATSNRSSGRESRDTNDSASSSTEGRRPSTEKVVTVVTPTQLVTPTVTSDELSISSNAEPIVAETNGLLNTTTKSHGDSEDELNDVESVNLVALDELNNSTKILAEDGKTAKRQRSVTGAEKSMEEGDKPHGEWKGNGVAKSGSQIHPLHDHHNHHPTFPNMAHLPLKISVGSNEMESCTESMETVGAGKGQWVKDLLDQTKRAMAMNSIREVEPPVPEELEPSTERQSRCQRGSFHVTEQCQNDEKTRRYFPYRFKHHTAQLLTGMSGGVQMQNRLISTDVLMGKFGDHDSKKNSRKDFGAGTAVLSTAVIARSSSAPRLMTYESDDFAVGEIKRFWPPLRSLETLHDSINLAQFDGFLERLIKGALTPLPSPPKTPLPSALSSDAINKTPTQDEVEKVIGKLAKDKQ